MGNAQLKRSKEGDGGDISGVDAADASSVDAAPPDVLKEPPPLTEDQKRLILETWKILEKDIASVGILVFINLFETYPDVQSSFRPFNGMILEDLKKSKQLRAHALRVMGAVQKAVFRLNEPTKLDAFLRELGRSHINYGAKLEYMDYIGAQFLTAIRPSLASKWTPEVEIAWATLLEFIVFVMKDTYIKESNLKNGTQT